MTVTSARVQGRDGASAGVAQACTKLPTLKRLYGDGAYAGLCAQALQAAHETGQATAPVPTGFVVLPRRWVVERTHAWNERCRRLVMHHDRSALIATAWHWFAHARMVVSRLAVCIYSVYTLSGP